MERRSERDGVISKTFTENNQANWNREGRNEGDENVIKNDISTMTPSRRGEIGSENDTALLSIAIQVLELWQEN